MKREWTDLEFADWTLLPSEAAQLAWDSATPKEPSRRVWRDSRRCADRLDDWSDEISNTKTENIYVVLFLAYDFAFLRKYGAHFDEKYLWG
jgi:hypothetical protein